MSIDSHELDHEKERYDRGYRVHESRKFQFGRVFEIPLEKTEENAHDLRGETKITWKVSSDVNHHFQTKQLLIVEEGKRFCVCRSVRRYRPGETNRKVADAKQHAFTYSDKPTRGLIEEKKEKVLKVLSIGVIPNGSRGMLYATFGLNYGEYFIIEYDVKVSFIGRLAKESELDVAIESGCVSKQYYTATAIASSLLKLSPSNRCTIIVSEQSSKAERILEELLFFDEDVQSLYCEALSKNLTTADMFETNIRQCILDFSENLEGEVTTPQVVNAAKYARANSRKLITEMQMVLTTRFEISNFAYSQAKLTDLQKRVNEERPFGQWVDTHELGVETATIKDAVSWKLFLEDFRLSLNPNQVERALCDIWPINIPRDMQNRISYVVRWEIPNYIIRNFPSGQSLGEILTLTGDTAGSIAQSCREYLQSNFHKIGLYVLEAVEALSIKKDIITLDLSYHDIEDKSVVDVTITASYFVHEKAALALSWLCAALREPSNDFTYYSSVAVQASKKTLAEGSNYNMKSRPRDIITVTPRDLHTTLDGTECWHTLFPRMVVAKGFPVRKRSQGRGLDISFADMALVAGCLSLVMFDDGLIANGLNSVLIPVGELSDDNAIQWHYRPKTAEDRKSRRPTFEIVEETGDWYKELNPHRLINRRCFLGWVPEASILIGTNFFSDTGITYSAAERVPDNRRVVSYNITLGTGGTGIFTATGSVGLTTSSMPSTITTKTEKDIHEILTDGINDTVLMYDSEKKTAWYLPQSCVVLFLVQARITRHCWQVLEGNELKHLKLANPGSGGSEANEALKANLNLHLKKENSQPAEGYREETVGSLIKVIWQALDDIGTGLRSIQKEFSRAKEHPPEYIYGVEYHDTVDMRETKNVKRAAVSQPWANLTKDYPTAIFCRFGENVEWNFDKKLMHIHVLGKKTAVHHVQLLRKTDRPQPNNGLLSLVAEHPNGSFIFNKFKLLKSCPEIVPSLAGVKSQIDSGSTNDINIGERQSTDHLYSSFDKQSTEPSSPIIGVRSNSFTEKRNANDALMRPAPSDISEWELFLGSSESATLNSNLHLHSPCSNSTLSSDIRNRSSMTSTRTSEDPEAQGPSNSLNCHGSISRKEDNPKPCN
ncbi:9cb629bc-3ff6-47b6-a860-8eeed4fb7b72 [Sclerotinia trifoliorum]|uniref:9cb629bc-3ff6-47b6-a860-8eeed4fb7b72 n=1 Tax=Sclerotinia trifoliorum TaxID=28548 RepID=A0A8H2VYQ0_9HELO|nr:9cb629bc-3ff6-47b6-a860-8eeed4fb7b72 [Sclerotinia trifoliorum]